MLAPCFLFWIPGVERMKKYLFWRVMQIIPVLLLISMFVFGLLYMAGDPVALMLPEDATQEQVDSLRASLGLDQPFYVQYFHFVGDLLRGDFGYSYRYNQPALPIVLERLPATFELAFSAMFVAIIMAIPLGIAQQLREIRF